MKTKALFILIKSLKILNLLIKILFSSENTRKLISGEGLVIRAGGSEIFSKKNNLGEGGVYSGSKTMIKVFLDKLVNDL